MSVLFRSRAKISSYSCLINFYKNVDNRIFIECLHIAYMDLDIKKPLRINAPKWLFYLVGPPRLELGTNGL